MENHKSAKLFTTAAMIDTMKNKTNEMMYGGFRPIIAISLRGENSIGPSPSDECQFLEAELPDEMNTYNQQHK